MGDWLSYFEPVFHGVVYLAAGLVCAGGIVLSCITFSGTWLVLLAGLMVHFLTPMDVSSMWTFILMLVLCVAVEGIEALSGSLGVKKRGGSNAAGVFAFFGGLLGLFIGSFIPPPVLGSLVGMFGLSYAAAYGWEVRRLKSHQQASSIAMGAVTARVFIIVFKIAVTLAMIAWLIIDLGPGVSS